MLALLGVALAYLTIVALDAQVDDLAGIALMLAVTACTALGALAAREPRRSAPSSPWRRRRTG